MPTPYKAESTKACEFGVLAKRGKPIFKNWSLTEGEFLASR